MSYSFYYKKHIQIHQKVGSYNPLVYTDLGCSIQNEDLYTNPVQ
jgi:hypothetical protein